MFDTCSSIIEELQEIRDLFLEVKEVRALIKNISDRDKERELWFASLDKELKLRKNKRKQLICSGIKESSAATSVGRYEDDKNVFKKLMTVMKFITKMMTSTLSAGSGMVLSRVTDYSALASSMK